MIVQAISSHVLYWRNGEFTTVTCTGDKLQDAINEWSHGRKLAHRTCGLDQHYQWNGYEWQHREAVEERSKQLQAIELRITDPRQFEYFASAIEMYRHLRAASAISIDGEWYIIDTISDPADGEFRDADHYETEFSSSIAIMTHSYDEHDLGSSEEIISWEKLFAGIADGSMELMRMTTMVLK